MARPALVISLKSKKIDFRVRVFVSKSEFLIECKDSKKVVRFVYRVLFFLINASLSVLAFKRDEKIILVVLQKTVTITIFFTIHSRVYVTLRRNSFGCDTLCKNPDLGSSFDNTTSRRLLIKTGFIIPKQMVIN